MLKGKYKRTIKRLDSGYSRIIIYGRKSMNKIIGIICFACTIKSSIQVAIILTVEKLIIANKFYNCIDNVNLLWIFFLSFSSFCIRLLCFLSSFFLTFASSVNNEWVKCIDVHYIHIISCVTAVLLLTWFGHLQFSQHLFHCYFFIYTKARSQIQPLTSIRKDISTRNPSGK